MKETFEHAKAIARSVEKLLDSMAESHIVNEFDVRLVKQAYEQLKEAEANYKGHEGT